MLLSAFVFLCISAVITVSVVWVEVWAARAMRFKLTHKIITVVAVANFATSAIGFALLITAETLSGYYLALLCLSSAVIQYFLIQNYNRSNEEESLHSTPGITTLDLVSKKTFMVAVAASIASYTYLYSIKKIIDVSLL
ncbi:hypothetical protein [Teredinibacter purpureus]|uniref:hypothetical protein n=1 Tax=Teredinibacter purpureus TaxID=2731756 RepID=UPI0005F7BA12|nr:hypothetical protein [Teredinibacter purpureus]